MKNISSYDDLKKNHSKIWNKIKPISESIEAVIDFKILNGDEEDNYRLTNLKMQFIRALVFAESEKYVSEKKPTKEGYVIDYSAVEYCFQKLFLYNYKRHKQITPSEAIIKEEAHKWAYLGIHPKINQVARKSYKKGNWEIMRQLAILIKDKNLNFNSPAVQFMKKNIFIIIVVTGIIIYLLIN